ncbi:MAG: NAD(P)H-binding protein [Dokdonia sp.]|jgi:uncharacterized protein YbjT (DUF2867 family)
MSKTILILGATGLTGGITTQLLLDDPEVAHVKIVTRRPSGINHTKAQDIVCDLMDLGAIASHFTGDAVICCIGTTKAQTPDKDEYYKIDHGIPVAAAQLAQQQQIPQFIVVSSLGTSVKSPFFYVRTKAEMERDVKKLGIGFTHIMKPSFINGRPDAARKGEKWLKRGMAVLDAILIGPLKKYRSVMASDIAKAMVYLVHHPLPDIDIDNPQIKVLSQRYES